MCNRSHRTQSISLQFAGSSSETVFSFRLAESFKYAFPHLRCALGRSGTGKGQRQLAASPRAQPFPTITAMMSVIKQAKCSSSGSEMEQSRQWFGLLPCGKDLVISFPRRRLVSAAGDFPEEIALPSPKGVTRAPEPLPLCIFHPNRTWVRPLTANSNAQVWVSRGLRVTPDPAQLRFPQVARGLHSYRKDSIKGKKSLWCCWRTGNRSWRKSLPRDECSGYWLCMTPGWEGGKGQREPEHHCGTQQFSSSSRIHYTLRDFWDFSYSWARQEVLIPDNWPFVSFNSSEATSACSFASNGDPFYRPFLWLQTDPGFAWVFFSAIMQFPSPLTYKTTNWVKSEESWLLHQVLPISAQVLS